MSNPVRRILAAASLHYYRWMKRRCRADIIAAFRETPAGNGASGEWLPLSRWLAASPRRERIMMMVGPRWNTAAVLAFTPVFSVRECLTVDVGEANRACTHWGVVVYDEQLRTIATIGNRSIGDEPDSARVALASGRYFLALRYYEPAVQAHYPGVWVDGEALVEATPVGGEPAQYAHALHSLGGRRHPIYRLMHYHAYAMLRDRNRFDEDTLRRHYLPVGNPETDFAFGVIAPGERVRVRAPATPGARTYVTFYGVDSIPCAWQALDAGCEFTRAAPEHGTYLVRRLRPRDAAGD